MKVTAIIAEYNPFHKGHAYQIELAKTFSDALVIVMSGSFVQRGDVAVFDKWKRAKAALYAGADLVIELPVVFSMNTAERFAFGGVSIIDKLKICDFLLFGSECGDIDTLKKAAYCLENEPKEVSEKIKSLMDDGSSFPAAREKAFEGLIDSSLLSCPNNILGLEYIRQLIRKNSKIIPLTHKRQGSEYHSEKLDTKFPSATAIRNAVLNDNFEYELFSDSPIHRLEKLDNAVLYNIRKNGHHAFSGICDVSEGLENRIITASKSATSIKDLETSVMTKRYTKTRIRRVILSSLLGLDATLSRQEPEYARILGSTKKGFELLKEIKLKSELKIITKTADFKEPDMSFEKDILSTDIYELTSDFPQGFGQDFKNSPVIIGGKDE